MMLTPIQRQTQWNAKLEQLKRVIDGMGQGIDEQIMDTVAALQLNGFTTTGSCEGHTDHGCAAPWVDVAAQGEPPRIFPGLKGLHITHRYNGQEESFSQVAAQHGITVQEMLRRDQEGYERNEPLIWEAQRQALQNGETPAYLAWRERNRAVQEELLKVMAGYPGADRIHLKTYHNGTMRLYTGSHDDLEGPRMPDLSHRLAVSQQEMANFASFLKERYLTIESRK